MENCIHVNDIVYKQHPYDGSNLAGKREGPPLIVKRITTHKPADGPLCPYSVVYLSDGTWCFIWNLTLKT